MFGIGNNFKYDPTTLKFMHLYTIVGAGGFGLLHLIAPNVFVLVLNAPSNTTMLGDMFVASVFLAFSVLAITNIKTPEKYAPIAGFPTRAVFELFHDVFHVHSPAHWPKRCRRVGLAPLFATMEKRRSEEVQM